MNIESNYYKTNINSTAIYSDTDILKSLLISQISHHKVVSLRNLFENTREFKLDNKDIKKIVSKIETSQNGIMNQVIGHIPFIGRIIGGSNYSLEKSLKEVTSVKDSVKASRDFLMFEIDQEFKKLNTPEGNKMISEKTICNLKDKFIKLNNSLIFIQRKEINTSTDAELKAQIKRDIHYFQAWQDKLNAELDKIVDEIIRTSGVLPHEFIIKVTTGFAEILYGTSDFDPYNDFSANNGSGGGGIVGGNNIVAPNKSIILKEEKAKPNRVLQGLAYASIVGSWAQLFMLSVCSTTRMYNTTSQMGYMALFLSVLNYNIHSNNYMLKAKEDEFSSPDTIPFFPGMKIPDSLKGIIKETANFVKIRYSNSTLFGSDALINSIKVRLFSKNYKEIINNDSQNGIYQLVKGQVAHMQEIEAKISYILNTTLKDVNGNYKYGLNETNAKRLAYSLAIGKKEYTPYAIVMESISRTGLETKHGVAFSRRIGLKGGEYTATYALKTILQDLVNNTITTPEEKIALDNLLNDTNLSKHLEQFDLKTMLNESGRDEIIEFLLKKYNGVIPATLMPHINQALNARFESELSKELLIVAGKIGINVIKAGWLISTLIEETKYEIAYTELSPTAERIINKVNTTPATMADFQTLMEKTFNLTPADSADLVNNLSSDPHMEAKSNFILGKEPIVQNVEDEIMLQNMAEIGVFMERKDFQIHQEGNLSEIAKLLLNQGKVEYTKTSFYKTLEKMFGNKAETILIKMANGYNPFIIEKQDGKPVGTVSSVREHMRITLSNDIYNLVNDKIPLIEKRNKSQILSEILSVKFAEIQLDYFENKKAKIQTYNNDYIDNLNHITGLTPNQANKLMQILKRHYFINENGFADKNALDYLVLPADLSPFINEIKSILINQPSIEQLLKRINIEMFDEFENTVKDLLAMVEHNDPALKAAIYIDDNHIINQEEFNIVLRDRLQITNKKSLEASALFDDTIKSVIKNKDGFKNAFNNILNALPVLTFPAGTTPEIKAKLEILFNSKKKYENTRFNFNNTTNELRSLSNLSTIDKEDEIIFKELSSLFKKAGGNKTDFHTYIEQMNAIKDSYAILLKMFGILQTLANQEFIKSPNSHYERFMEDKTYELYKYAKALPNILPTNLHGLPLFESIFDMAQNFSQLVLDETNTQRFNVLTSLNNLQLGTNIIVDAISNAATEMLGSYYEEASFTRKGNRAIINEGTKDVATFFDKLKELPATHEFNKTLASMLKLQESQKNHVFIGDEKAGSELNTLVKEVVTAILNKGIGNDVDGEFLNFEDLEKKVIDLITGETDNLSFNVKDQLSKDGYDKEKQLTIQDFALESSFQSLRRQLELAKIRSQQAKLIINMYHAGKEKMILSKLIGSEAISSKVNAKRLKIWMNPRITDLAKTKNILNFLKWADDYKKNVALKNNKDKYNDLSLDEKHNLNIEIENLEGKIKRYCDTKDIDLVQTYFSNLRNMIDSENKINFSPSNFFNLNATQNIIRDLKVKLSNYVKDTATLAKQKEELFEEIPTIIFDKHQTKDAENMEINIRESIINQLLTLESIDINPLEYQNMVSKIIANYIKQQNKTYGLGDDNERKLTAGIDASGVFNTLETIASNTYNNQQLLEATWQQNATPAELTAMDNLKDNFSSGFMFDRSGTPRGWRRSKAGNTNNILLGATHTERLANKIHILMDLKGMDSTKSSRQFPDAFLNEIEINLVKKIIIDTDPTVDRSQKAKKGMMADQITAFIVNKLPNNNLSDLEIAQMIAELKDFWGLTSSQLEQYSTISLKKIDSLLKHYIHDVATAYHATASIQNFGLNKLVEKIANFNPNIIDTDNYKALKAIVSPQLWAILSTNTPVARNLRASFLDYLNNNIPALPIEITNNLSAKEASILEEARDYVPNTNLPKSLQSKLKNINQQANYLFGKDYLMDEYWTWSAQFQQWNTMPTSRNAFSAAGTMLTSSVNKKLNRFTHVNDFISDKDRSYQEIFMHEASMGTYPDFINDLGRKLPFKTELRKLARIMDLMQEMGIDVRESNVLKVLDILTENNGKPAEASRQLSIEYDLETTDQNKLNNFLNCNDNIPLHNYLDRRVFIRATSQKAQATFIGNYDADNYSFLSYPRYADAIGVKMALRNTDSVLKQLEIYDKYTENKPALINLNKKIVDLSFQIETYKNDFGIKVDTVAFENLLQDFDNLIQELKVIINQPVESLEKQKAESILNNLQNLLKEQIAYLPMRRWILASQFGQNFLNIENDLVRGQQMTDETNSKGMKQKTLAGCYNTSHLLSISQISRFESLPLIDHPSNQVWDYYYKPILSKIFETKENKAHDIWNKTNLTESDSRKYLYDDNGKKKDFELLRKIIINAIILPNRIANHLRVSQGNHIYYKALNAVKILSIFSITGMMVGNGIIAGLPSVAIAAFTYFAFKYIAKHFSASMLTAMKNLAENHPLIAFSLLIGSFGLAIAGSLALGGGLEIVTSTFGLQVIGLPIPALLGTISGIMNPTIKFKTKPETKNTALAVVVNEINYDQTISSVMSNYDNNKKSWYSQLHDWKREGRLFDRWFFGEEEVYNEASIVEDFSTTYYSLLRGKKLDYYEHTAGMNGALWWLFPFTTQRSRWWGGMGEQDPFIKQMMMLNPNALSPKDWLQIYCGANGPLTSGSRQILLSNMAMFLGTMSLSLGAAVAAGLLPSAMAITSVLTMPLLFSSLKFGGLHLLAGVITSHLTYATTLGTIRYSKIAKGATYDESSQLFATVEGPGSTVMWPQSITRKLNQRSGFQQTFDAPRPMMVDAKDPSLNTARYAANIAKLEMAFIAAISLAGAASGNLAMLYLLTVIWWPYVKSRQISNGINMNYGHATDFDNRYRLTNNSDRNKTQAKASSVYDIKNKKFMNILEEKDPPQGLVAYSGYLKSILKLE